MNLCKMMMCSVGLILMSLFFAQGAEQSLPSNSSIMFPVPSIQVPSTARSYSSSSSSSSKSFGKVYKRPNRYSVLDDLNCMFKWIEKFIDDFGDQLIIKSKTVEDFKKVGANGWAKDMLVAAEPGLNAYNVCADEYCNGAREAYQSLKIDSCKNNQIRKMIYQEMVQAVRLLFKTNPESINRNFKYFLNMFPDPILQMVCRCVYRDLYATAKKKFDKYEAQFWDPCLDDLSVYRVYKAICLMREQDYGVCYLIQLNQILRPYLATILAIIEPLSGKKVKTLSLCSNELTTIPQAVLLLDQLEELDLYDNQLDSLPDGLSSLRHLKRIRVGKNKISKIPPSFKEKFHEPLEIVY